MIRIIIFVMTYSAHRLAIEMGCANHSSDRIGYIITMSSIHLDNGSLVSIYDSR